jgi:chaperone BCS1
VPAKWNGWNRRRDLPLRTLESVVLKDGALDDIIADLKDFLAKEEKYAQRSIPWHRGYLFYGPPGTGKTSALRAIATHFGLDCYYLSLGDLDKDTDLLELISQVPERCMLILEDVDVFGAATERDDDSGATLSGLLNALDGVATPWGLVVCMTSNHREDLDPALVRAGRIDREFKLDYVDSDQLCRLFAWFYEAEPKVPFLAPPNLAPADALEIFKEHIDDLEAAEEKLHAACRMRLAA